MKVFFRIIPVILVESIARTAGYIVGVLRPQWSGRIEQVVRGRYWAFRLGGREGLLVGKTVQFEGTNFTFGENVRVFDGSQLVTGGAGFIRIGSGTHIGRMSVVSGLGGVEIGENCAISAQVCIFSSSTNTKSLPLGSGATLRDKVVVGNEVYLGAGVRIIPGVTVGDGAVVAAGAVVIRDVPPGMLAKGVPATCTPLDRRMDSTTRGPR